MSNFAIIAAFIASPKKKTTTTADPLYVYTARTQAVHAFNCVILGWQIKQKTGDKMQTGTQTFPIYRKYWIANTLF